MLKKPLVIGCNGSMGKRYMAILKYLGLQCIGIDKGDDIPTEFDSVIIAAPTDTHTSLCRTFRNWPILVEKPLARSLDDALTACDFMDTMKVRVRMVNQYRHMVDRWSEGNTEYNYFRHGSDGLYLDCISIIALAKGRVSLMESSPVWTCMINGKNLDFGRMDYAYIREIGEFLNKPPEAPETDYIRDAHLKVAALEEADRG